MYGAASPSPHSPHRPHGHGTQWQLSWSLTSTGCSPPVFVAVENEAPVAPVVVVLGCGNLWNSKLNTSILAIHMKLAMDPNVSRMNLNHSSSLVVPVVVVLGCGNVWNINRNKAHQSLLSYALHLHTSGTLYASLYSCTCVRLVKAVQKACIFEICDIKNGSSYEDSEQDTRHPSDCWYCCDLQHKNGDGCKDSSRTMTVAKIAKRTSTIPVIVVCFVSE